MKLSEWMERQKRERDIAKLQKRHLKEEDARGEYAKRRATMHVSTVEGGFHAAMEGFSDQFITPFALLLGATTQMVGILGSIPQLIGAFFQLFSDVLLRIWSNRVKVITIATFIQAVLWLPFLLLPDLPHSVILLIGIVTLIQIVSMLQGPIWNSVMGDIVPAEERGRYFGKRTSIVTFVSFSSIFMAGLILNYTKSQDVALIGFCIVFFLAFLFKLISGIVKAKMYDPPHKLPAPIKGQFWSFLKNMPKTNYGRFVLFMLILKIAMGFSAPFFAVLELRDLHFTYLQFTIIAVTGSVAGFLSLRAWGRLIDMIGSRNVLLLNGFLIPIFPLVWVFFPHFWVIFAIEMISGASWAGFNLATSNFIFDATLVKNRTKHVAYFNFFAGVGMFVGAVIAGYISKVVPSTNIAGVVSNIPVLLIMSAGLRLIAVVAILTTTHESRLIEIAFEKTFWNIPLGRSVMIMPSGSSMFEIGGRRQPFGPIPRPHHLAVDPRHFDHMHHDSNAQEHGFVKTLLASIEAKKQRYKDELIGSEHDAKDDLVVTPEKDETPAVDDILNDIKKGKFDRNDVRRR